MSAEETLRPATPLPRPQSRSSRWRLWIAWLILVVITGYYLIICCEIVWQSHRDEARPADVIIVFGAAQYSGHPSPVLRARLDHALTLYSQGLAPYLITTGGSGGDPQFSEGGVGRDYLESRGISERHLIAETQGENTAESVERVAVIMRTNNMRTCVVVSDPYHLFRIKRLMQRQAITTYASPRPYPAHGLWFSVGHVMREAFSYLTQRVRPA